MVGWSVGERLAACTHAGSRTAGAWWTDEQRRGVRRFTALVFRDLRFERPDHTCQLDRLALPPAGDAAPGDRRRGLPERGGGAEHRLPARQARADRVRPSGRVSAGGMGSMFGATDPGGRAPVRAGRCRGGLRGWAGVVGRRPTGVLRRGRGRKPGIARHPPSGRRRGLPGCQEVARHPPPDEARVPEQCVRKPFPSVRLPKVGPLGVRAGGVGAFVPGSGAARHRAI